MPDRHTDTHTQLIWAVPSLERFGDKLCVCFFQNRMEEATEAQPSAKAGKKRKSPGSSGSKTKKAKTEVIEVPNPLDMTAIHPESYLVAEKLMEDQSLQSCDIGSEAFIARIARISQSEPGMN